MGNWKPEKVNGKAVYDRDNTKIGTMDKYWAGWKELDYVFGIKLEPVISARYVKGITKLMPVQHGDIATVTENVSLNKTVEELSEFWNQEVVAGGGVYSATDFWQKHVCDSENTKIGTIHTTVRATPRGLKLFGLCLEPVISEKYAEGATNLVPINAEHISKVEENVFLNKTIGEISRYWKKTTE
ncbi:MAG: hypothetical protein KJ935_06825 [Candidatus Omnitrophica bacterium]|nr:hypothetical protein [Candidatus Omnitrophota bacterium]